MLNCTLHSLSRPQNSSPHTAGDSNRSHQCTRIDTEYRTHDVLVGPACLLPHASPPPPPTPPPWGWGGMQGMSSDGVWLEHASVASTPPNRAHTGRVLGIPQTPGRRGAPERPTRAAMWRHGGRPVSALRRETSTYRSRTCCANRHSLRRHVEPQIIVSYVNRDQDRWASPRGPFPVLEWECGLWQFSVWGGGGGSRGGFGDPSSRKANSKNWKFTGCWNSQNGEKRNLVWQE